MILLLTNWYGKRALMGKCGPFDAQQHQSLHCQMCAFTWAQAHIFLRHFQGLQSSTTSAL
jgi:His-Xaa-Ser system protein HxsD